MSLTRLLLDIMTMVNDNGGTDFLKIRATLDEVDKLAELENPRAMQFKTEMQHIHDFLAAIVK